MSPCHLARPGTAGSAGIGSYATSQSAWRIPQRAVDLLYLPTSRRSELVGTCTWSQSAGRRRRAVFTSRYLPVQRCKRTEHGSHPPASALQRHVGNAPLPPSLSSIVLQMQLFSKRHPTTPSGAGHNRSVRFASASRDKWTPPFPFRIACRERAHLVKSCMAIWETKKDTLDEFPPNLTFP